MSWVAAGIASGAATMAGVQYIKGKRDQMKDAKNRPQYEIPSEIQANMSLAQQQALQGLPEEQKQQYINNLQRSQAFSLSQMGSRKAGLAGVAEVNQQGADAYSNLLTKDAQARMQNQDKLYGANQTMADYKDQAFQLNELNPYYEGIARKQARTAALFQNLNSAATMGMSGIGGKGKTSQGSNQPQANTQMMQRDTQMNQNNYYNPYKPQSGTMMPDGQYGSYPNQNIG